MKKARKFLVLVLCMLDAVVAVTRWRYAALLLMVNSLALLCLIVCSFKTNETEEYRSDDIKSDDGNEHANYGEWIEDDYAYCRCSECGYEYDSPEYSTPYCPNCGACMEDEHI